MQQQSSKSRAIVLLLSVLVAFSNAYAVKPPGPLVTNNNTTKVLHVANVNGKSVNATVYCYRQSGGQIQKIGSKKYFVSFTNLIKAAQAKLKLARTKKDKNKLKSQIALFKVLKVDSPALCTTAQEPSHTLAKYSGPFGLKQAQRLVEVFGLGGRPGLADSYVSMGLDAAIADLTTLRDDSEVDAFRERLTCGSHPRQPELDTCYDQGDINDFYLDGLVAGINWKMIYSNNPAHMKLLQFVMDERAPANPRVLDGEAQWMFKDYLAKLERFAVNGDYKAFVADMVNDPVEHGMWLSGGSNHQGVLKVGNEDFARESMELLTTGLYKPDGSAVYTDLDVYENSKVMSGLSVSRVVDAHGNGVKAVGYFSAFHAQGPKRLFAGTPQEMVIDTADDFAREIFVKQRDQVAYELAWRMWRRFINSSGTLSDHLLLADVIKANDFKLWPVLKQMMASQAFYAPESYKTILKDPNTFYVTAARMSGMPQDKWDWVNFILDDVGMRLGRPPTVFGFNYQNLQLNSDLYQLERYNGLVYHFLWQNADDLEAHYGWTPHSGMVASIPRTGNPGQDLVNEVMKRMNLADSWNADQKAALEHSISYYLYSCSNQNDPACFMYKGNRMKWYRDAPDLDDSNDDFYRVRMAYMLAAMSPAFASM